MCIAAPGKILSVEKKIAQIEYPGRIVNQAMILDVSASVGDFVLVQMGVVIKVLSDEESDSSREAWKETEQKLTTTN